MEYNTERSPLIIPEYGRHIHRMIKHAVSIDNKEERNRCAQAIIAVMGNLNPHLRDVPDFKHKLWDQLFIMSGFNLDVDSPFPKPSPEKFTQKPDALNYPRPSHRYRFYGKNILEMIKVAKSWEEGEKKEGLIYVIANHMKKCFLLWNKDTVEDRVIFKHLKELSGGNIDLTNSKDKLKSTSILTTNRKRSFKTTSNSNTNNRNQNYKKTNRK